MKSYKLVSVELLWIWQNDNKELLMRSRSIDWKYVPMQADDAALHLVEQRRQQLICHNFGMSDPLTCQMLPGSIKSPCQSAEKYSKEHLQVHIHLV